MKSIVKYIVLVALFFVVSYSQANIKLENDYNKNLSKLNLLNKSNDSLNLLLQKKTIQIENEKNKSDKNSNLLNELYSQFSNLAQKVKSKTVEINKIKENIEKNRVAIHNHYSTKLDSLNSISNPNSLIERQILNYSQKVLVYSPKIVPLKYEPSKLIELQKQSKDNNYLADYFIEAANEVDQQLTVIDNMINEVAQIDRTKRKTEEFIQEVDFSSNFIVSSNLLTEETKIRTDSGEKNYETLTSNINSLNLIVNQISSAGIINEKNIKSINEKNVSLEQYKNYLLEVKKYLVIYKKVLKQKK